MNRSTEIAFKIISSAGAARSLVFTALEKANELDFEVARELLEESEVYLNEAHKIQFEIISQESAQELSIEVNFILVHAQDHLMTAILAKELMKEIICNKQELYELKRKVNYD